MIKFEYQKKQRSTKTKNKTPKKTYKHREIAPWSELKMNKESKYK